MLTPIQITHAAPGKWIAPEYSSVCPWRDDNGPLLLVAVDHFQLYTGDGVFLEDSDIGASERPRWSGVSPTFLRGNTIFVDADIQRTFAEYVSIDDGGEADSQDDTRVLYGVRPDGSREIFVYQLSTGIKGPVLDVTDHPIESLYLTPSGKVLISWA